MNSVLSDFYSFRSDKLISRLKELLGKKDWIITIIPALNVYNEDEVKQNMESSPVKYSLDYMTKKVEIIINTTHPECLDAIGIAPYTGWLYHVLTIVIGLEILPYVSEQYSFLVLREMNQIAWGIALNCANQLINYTNIEE